MFKLIISEILLAFWAIIAYKSKAPDAWAILFSGAILLPGWIANDN